MVALVSNVLVTYRRKDQSNMMVHRRKTRTLRRMKIAHMINPRSSVERSGSAQEPLVVRFAIVIHCYGVSRVLLSVVL